MLEVLIKRFLQETKPNHPSPSPIHHQDQRLRTGKTRFLYTNSNSNNSNHEHNQAFQKKQNKQRQNGTDLKNGTPETKKIGTETETEHRIRIPMPREKHEFPINVRSKETMDDGSVEALKNYLKIDLKELNHMELFCQKIKGKSLIFFDIIA